MLAFRASHKGLEHMGLGPVDLGPMGVLWPLGSGCMGPARVGPWPVPVGLGPMRLELMGSGPMGLGPIGKYRNARSK